MADNFEDIIAPYGVVGHLFVTMGLQDEGLLQAIEAAGVDVNVADPSGKTLLMHAAHCAAICKKGKLRRRMLAGISLLLKNGANVNLADERGTLRSAWHSHSAKKR